MVTVMVGVKLLAVMARVRLLMVTVGGWPLVATVTVGAWLLGVGPWVGGRVGSVEWGSVGAGPNSCACLLCSPFPVTLSPARRRQG